ncbi:MAG: RNA methyltransferase [Bdellovibrionales bacterium]|nr:RNA methyltransferase [Bdellovibrionales bacterium]
MNSLLFYPQELTAPDRAVVRGERFRYIQEWHAPQEGVEVSALLYGECVGRATLRESSSTHSEFSVAFDGAAPQLLPVELILAIPRPQTVKKVLQLSATFGIEKIHLVSSDRVVKSYRQSKVLESNAVAEELLKGLEQGSQPIAPKVEIHNQLHIFFSDVLPSFQDDKGEQQLRLLADTREHTRVSLDRFRSDCCEAKKVLLAIGPESGWAPREVERFLHEGFHALWLSHSQLRVETALAVALGQLELYLPRRS